LVIYYAEKPYLHGGALIFTISLTPSLSPDSRAERIIREEA
jgi:hypothetical protein